MTEADQKCVLCYDDAIHEMPKVLCDNCFVEWIEDGDWVIDEGCPIARQRMDDHVMDCDVCCTADNNWDYCPVGESLVESWLDTVDLGSDEEPH